MLSSIPVVGSTIPVLWLFRVKEVLKLNENVAGRAGLAVETPPVKENLANGNFTAATFGAWLVVADETAAVEIANAAAAAPARMAMARADVPGFLTDPPGYL